MGNWPWAHPVEGGHGASQYSFAKTSISNKDCRCIGFARRRVGRGGRMNFDRAHNPFSSSELTDECEETPPHIDSDRVPPWLAIFLHFLLIIIFHLILFGLKLQRKLNFENCLNFSYRPHYKRLKRESSSEDTDSEKSYHNSFDWFKKTSTDHNNETDNASDKFHSYKSFSSEPTSRFRVQPYTHKRTHKQSGRGKKLRLFSHSQMLTNSSMSSVSKNSVVDSQNWILRRFNNTSNNNASLNHKKIANLGTRKTSPQYHMSPSKPASIAPASAIYQLNFPIVVTKTPAVSTATTKSKTEAMSTNKNSTNSNNNNNTIMKTVAASKTSLQNAIHASLVNDSGTVLPLQITGSTSSNPISRQPLSAVQQKSLIAAQQQKIISQSSAVSVSVTTQSGTTVGGTLLQVQPVVNNVRTNKINNLPKGLTINHTTSAVVTNGITTQPQSIQQLAR